MPKLVGPRPDSRLAKGGRRAKTQTRNPLLRRQMLYPIELRALPCIVLMVRHSAGTARFAYSLIAPSRTRATDFEDELADCRRRNREGRTNERRVSGRSYQQSSRWSENRRGKPYGVAPCPSSSSTSRLTSNGPKLSTRPLGQRASTRRISSAVPTPKCNRMSLWDM